MLENMPVIPLANSPEVDRSLRTLFAKAPLGLSEADLSKEAGNDPSGEASQTQRESQDTFLFVNCGDEKMKCKA